MNFFSKAIPWLVLLAIALLTNCNKDNLSPENPNQRFDWTPEEESFFALGPQKIVSNRDSIFSHSLFHPLLLQARQKLILENNERPFVQAIVNNSGLPAWPKSYIYCNPQTKDKLVIIPLVSEVNMLVTGFITLYKKDEGTDSDFVINGMSRSELLDTTSGNPYQKGEYVKFMMKYDKMLFQKLDVNLKNAYCHYRSNQNGSPSANGIPPFSPPPFGCNEALPTSSLCEWRILEVCSDSESHNTWFGGTYGPLPSEVATWFDGDHDDDGILDQEDEDYYDWYFRFNDWWDNHFDNDWEGAFDGDHDDDGILDEFDSDWDLFFSLLEGQFDDLGDWFHDIWDDVDDWWDDIWDGDIGCPYLDDPIAGSADDRTISCEWFYVLDCGAGSSGANWYDTFVDVVPCPECPGYTQYHDMLRDRLYEHWNKEYACAIDFWDLYNAYDELDWDCNAYSPCFESCVDEHFANTPIILAPPQGTIITDLNSEFQSCFDQSCVTCTYSVTLYIEQPTPGSRNAYTFYSGFGSSGSGSGSGSGYNSGHTFISLNQVDANGYIKQKTIGFYPNDSPSGQNQVPGFWYDEDLNSSYNVKVRYDVTASQFETIKTKLVATYELFQIQYNNCTTVATYPLISAGIPIPQTPCHVPLAGSINATPSNLAEDLRLNAQGGNFTSFPVHLFLSTFDLSNCH